MTLIKQLINRLITNKSVTHVKDNTALDKVIEQDGALAKSIKLSHQSTNQIIGQPVAKGGEGSFQLILVNIS